LRRLVIVSVASLNEHHRASYDLLARSGEWEVHIVAPESLGFTGGRKTCDAPPVGASYRLHPLRLAFEKSGRFVWFRGLSKLLRILEPDAVFLEEDPGSLSMLQAFAARPTAKRIAFTVENIARDRFADALGAVRALKPRDAVRDLVVGLLLTSGQAATSGLACISNEGERLFRAAAWKKPLEVIPLGTDTQRFTPSEQVELRAQLGLSGAFVVGYFGRLVPEKGVHLLIDALPSMPAEAMLLLDMFPNFSPGSYAASLLQRAEALGVRERVITMGVSHSEVHRYMNCCDTIVLPSLTTTRWKEQFGRVLPEAMACGVAAIGSRSGNIPDMIGDAGLLIPEGDAAAIATAVTQLASDPALRHALGMGGRQRVKALFSVEVQVARMESLLAAC